MELLIRRRGAAQLPLLLNLDLLVEGQADGIHVMVDEIKGAFWRKRPGVMRRFMQNRIREQMKVDIGNGRDSSPICSMKNMVSSYLLYLVASGVEKSEECIHDRTEG